MCLRIFSLQWMEVVFFFKQQGRGSVQFFDAFCHFSCALIRTPIACQAYPRYGVHMNQEMMDGSDTVPFTRRYMQRFQVSYAYPVIFTRQAFAPDNLVLQEVLQEAGAGPHRLAVFIDSGVAASFPDIAHELTEHFQGMADMARLATPPIIVSGGEQAKADSNVLDMALEVVREHALCRQSFMLVIGGGAVLDAVGFAAATAHRGVRLIRMPSTVLAQNDAGVGVKNGINLFGRKNFWGVHAPPFAVINDSLFLQGLSRRELREGVAEAVKVALIRDPEMFRWLMARRRELAELLPGAMEEMIRRCAEAHLQHIACCGDPFELGSARPLDFGHWAAHALEEMSAGELRHGEAVAVGTALDSIYSHLAGLLGKQDMETILSLLKDLGLPMSHPLLKQLDVEGALSCFREHLGGQLHVSLLTGLGASREVTSIDTALMHQARETLMQRFKDC